MVRSVHFGAGNIGRGFIGEILHKNNIQIDFVDINAAVIDALIDRQSYTVQLADQSQEEIQIDNVTGINNQTDPEAVVQAVAKCQLVTTAIGPNILPHIAPLIAQGIAQRAEDDRQEPLDIIACENMIGGSSFLKEEVLKHLDSKYLEYCQQWIGFPNAAVDRIVPEQSHEDPLLVVVEPFKEWVIEQKDRKNTDLELDGVIYVDQLEPYIERKLFSVNTGHATSAYLGFAKGYQTIDEALQDSEIVSQLQAVLSETGRLLQEKWGFSVSEHEQYMETIIQRFQNPHISDAITRVARTPIRKLGYDERFIRPLRELTERNLPTEALLSTIGYIFAYDEPSDDQSVELQTLLANEPVDAVIRQVTGLTDEALIAAIRDHIPA